jgi:hypothetical protein
MLQTFKQAYEDMEDRPIGGIKINRIVSNEVLAVSCVEPSGSVTRQISTEIRM